MSSGDEVVAGRWQPDPIGKHAFRWHDSTALTGWVTDGNRQSFDPIGSATRAISTQAFKSQRDSLRRLVIGLLAMAASFGLTLFTATSSVSLVIILPVGAFVWGVVEVVRASRFLARGRQPANVPTTAPPRRLNFSDEIRVLDDRLHSGKLSRTAYDLAAIKLRRRYNVEPPE